MTASRVWKWAGFFIILWALEGCGGSSSDASSGDHSLRIHMLVAPSGRLVPAPPEGGDSHSWTLVLDKSASQPLWYTDRPLRSTGSSTLKDYARSLWTKTYGSVPPNATLHFRLVNGKELEGVYATLSQPHFDEKSGTLRFPAKVLASSVQVPTNQAMELQEVTLNVLNNAVDSKEVASYVQYASQAVWQPQATGLPRLVLSEADARMLWVDNAPGQYHDSRPTTDFFLQWRTTFGNNPPNAAVFGSSASGRSHLYFLTLRDPAYDPVAGKVSYAVSMLDGQAPPNEALERVVMSIDSGQFSRFPAQGKGTAYQAFGHGYDPSSANNSYIYFGSDIARKQFGSLWGTQSYLRQVCASDCRNDLLTLKDMGANLIRLYDWDPRNDHSQFLDYAHRLNLKVVVPISNWLAKHPEYWDAQLPAYFNELNFGRKVNGNLDWHPAIAAVTIANELEIEQGGEQSYQTAIGLVARFLEKSHALGFSRSMRVGMPVSFGVKAGGQPAWHLFDWFANDKRLALFKDQLMLNPNSYNDRSFLFGDAQSRQPGWVQATYARYKLPILFTEIGANRVERPDQSFVREQLQGALEYQSAHPEQLLGAIHFQFDNKVWKQSPDPNRETDTEGSFGAFRHGDIVRTMQTEASDYHFPVDEARGNYGSFSINRLLPTATHQAVVQAYR